MREPIGYRPARRHPFQVLLAGMCVLGGLPVLITGAAPGSIQETLPTLLLYVWGATLVCSGSLVVGAAIIRSPVNALYLEMIAHPALALVAFAYGAAVFTAAGLRGVTGGLIIIGLGVSAGARFFQVRSTFRRVRHSVREDPPGGVG